MHFSIFREYLAFRVNNEVSGPVVIFLGWMLLRETTQGKPHMILVSQLGVALEPLAGEWIFVPRSLTCGLKSKFIRKANELGASLDTGLHEVLGCFKVCLEVFI